MAEMEEPAQNQPIHSDIPARRLNLTLIAGIAVAVMGLGTPVLMLLGLAVAAYSWLTSPRHYQIYQNALVIVYGSPRKKAIMFSDISHLEVLSLPVGERLRLRLVNGRRVMLTTKNPEAFRQHLDEALERFQGSSPRDQIPGEVPQNKSPY